ncbi:MAG: ABC transporter permease [Acutalibacteraceae bacterium]
MSDKVKKAPKVKNHVTLKDIKQQKWLLAMLLPGMIWIFIFCFLPMYGVIIAFQDYNIIEGVFGSQWVGLANFKELFSDVVFLQSLKSTVIISLLKFAFSFPAPILFALFLNELKQKRFKKFVQSSTYLPTFLSWVFVVGFTYSFLDVNGPINNALVTMGLIDEPILFLSEPSSFIVIVIIQEVWKGFGYGSIIFLAAISGLDSGVYESATIDGAGRFKQMFHITLPMLKPTIAILFIINIAGVLGSNFDQMYTMGNIFVSDWSNVLSVYSYSIGIVGGQYSLASAMGLFGSVVSVLLLLIANFSVKKLTGESYL